jgi:diguanylate cyclase (GGDEF)-like protein
MKLGLEQCQPEIGSSACLATPAGRYGFLQKARKRLDYAFQPIVDIHTGNTFGYEALLRGFDRLGFDSVSGLLNYAREKGLFSALNQVTRTLAIEQFANIAHFGQVKLFLNIDPPILAHDDRFIDSLEEQMRRFGIPPSTLCLELTEINEVEEEPQVYELINRLRSKMYSLVLDDFGTGYSGLKTLYDHTPNIIKIDRYFISEIARNPRKRLFVTHTVELAHTLGITVIAEGVETEEEFLTCKEMGCELVQGYFIARPILDVDELKTGYAIVKEVNLKDKRNTSNDVGLISAQIKEIAPVREDTQVAELFDIFSRNPSLSMVPVVSYTNTPLGVVYESSLKQLSYSNYGKELMQNKVFRKPLSFFMSSCPIVDINSSAESFLKAYVSDEEYGGVIVVEDQKYYGFLSSIALLRLLNEKNLAIARDQNPLSRLPGNNSIIQYVNEALDQQDDSLHLIYIDFDNFKPFNDKYGFRQGDRAINMFADLMRKRLSYPNCFLGHVGGDDFFIGIANESVAEAWDRIGALRATFQYEVESLYDSESRSRGYIEMLNREGMESRMPLLTFSAAILSLPVRLPGYTLETLSSQIADLKQAAKLSEGGLAQRSVTRELIAVS